MFDDKSQTRVTCGSVDTIHDKPWINWYENGLYYNTDNCNHMVILHPIHTIF